MRVLCASLSGGFAGVQGLDFREKICTWDEGGACYSSWRIARVSCCWLGP